MTGVTHNDLAITFRPDGTFSTGPVDVHATVQANHSPISGEGHASGQASGTWSAGGGHFNLCTTPGSLHTTVTIVVHGRAMTVTPPVPSHPQATVYTWNMALLTTALPIPGHEPIVTHYGRGH